MFKSHLENIYNLFVKNNVFQNIYIFPKNNIFSKYTRKIYFFISQKYNIFFSLLKIYIENDLEILPFLVKENLKFFKLDVYV